MEAVIPYEQQLGADFDWALKEGSNHFERRNAVWKALHRVAQRLEELGVSYAVAGGLALFFHGYRRFTEDVDILVTHNDLKRIHDKLENEGWFPLFAGSKHLRETENGVKIEFLVTGNYPGDGKEKPVAFPDPATVFTLIDGIKVLNLPTLVQLKLASGTALYRRKDLADAQELIRVKGLNEEFADQLDPWVRASYLQIWKELQQATPDE